MTEQTNQMEHVKVLIIGSSPAGYTAALYTGRASLQPVLYCGPLTGGQLTQTTEIENFPGYPWGVDANQMMLEFREQAERFGADIRDGEVESCDFSQRPYRVKFTDGTQMTADTVIIATGASAKYLGLDDEKKYAGKRVSLPAPSATVSSIARRSRPWSVVATLPVRTPSTLPTSARRSILWFASPTCAPPRSCRTA